MGIDQRTFRIEEGRITQFPALARILEKETYFGVNNATAARACLTIDVELSNNCECGQDLFHVTIMFEKTYKTILTSDEKQISCFTIDAHFPDTSQTEEWLYKLGPAVLSSLFGHEKVPDKQIDRTLFCFVDCFKELHQTLRKQQECRASLVRGTKK